MKETYINVLQKYNKKNSEKEYAMRKTNDKRNIINKSVASLYGMIEFGHSKAIGR